VLDIIVACPKIYLKLPALSISMAAAEFSWTKLASPSVFDLTSAFSVCPFILIPIVMGATVIAAISKLRS
jgi:hypothetical protein